MISCSCLLPLLPGFFVCVICVICGCIIVKEPQFVGQPLEGLDCGDFCGGAARAIECLSLLTPLVDDYGQALELG